MSPPHSTFSIVLTFYEQFMGYDFQCVALTCPFLNTWPDSLAHHSSGQSFRGQGTSCMDKF